MNNINIQIDLLSYLPDIIKQEILNGNQVTIVNIDGTIRAIFYPINKRED